MTSKELEKRERKRLKVCYFHVKPVCGYFLCIIQHINQAIEEIITTERTYVHQLNLLISIYIDGLFDGKIISQKQHATLFTNDIRSIQHLNTNFLASV